MDEIVRQAISKWPDVPHCFGWLMLDARGHWRMRDERAQRLGLPGDKIFHAALLGFINRNYMHDAAGQWYFQNGPQRVYVDLELTPYIVRTDPTAGFVMHTGEQLPAPDAVWLTQDGRLLLQAGGIIAAVDDRDIAGVLSSITSSGIPASDALLMQWLNAGHSDHRPDLILHMEKRHLPLQWIDAETLPVRFRFVGQPRKPA